MMDVEFDGKKMTKIPPKKTIKRLSKCLLDSLKYQIDYFKIA